MTAADSPGSTFETFAATVGRRVERALVAAYGVEIGVEAAADAMTVAWERWPELSAMTNPAGYLFRIGQSKARKHVRWARGRATFPSSSKSAIAFGSDNAALLDVSAALSRLKREQRLVVVLVRSYGFSYAETAEVLGVTEAAVGTHLRRGMAALRQLLEVPHDDD